MKEEAQIINQATFFLWMTVSLPRLTLHLWHPIVNRSGTARYERHKEGIVPIGFKNIVIGRSVGQLRQNFIKKCGRLLDSGEPVRLIYRIELSGYREPMDKRKGRSWNSVLLRGFRLLPICGNSPSTARIKIG